MPEEGSAGVEDSLPGLALFGDSKGGRSEVTADSGDEARLDVDVVGGTR